MRILLYVMRHISSLHLTLQIMLVSCIGLKVAGVHRGGAPGSYSFCIIWAPATETYMYSYSGLNGRPRRTLVGGRYHILEINDY